MSNTGIISTCKIIREKTENNKLSKHEGGAHHKGIYSVEEEVAKQTD
jgi:hypothetical protein